MKIYVDFDRSPYYIDLYTEDELRERLKKRRAEGLRIYVGEVNKPGLASLTMEERVALGACGGTRRRYEKANLEANGTYVDGWEWPEHPEFHKRF